MLTQAEEFKLKVTFKVKLYKRKSVYREIYLPGIYTLEDLAIWILKAYKFNFDHCFGFYSDFKDMYASEEIYELFVDLSQEEGQNWDYRPNAKSVKKTFIRDVFEPKKKMLFYFDYGDDWAFEVVCTKKVMTDIGKDDSKILKVEGKAPKQYPKTKKDQEDWWELRY